jgi:serine/threonine-protein kinase
MDELIGKAFGPYKVLEKIGEGGMGVVYKGYQESLSRYVAIKVLRGELAHDQRFIARFRREALAVAKLSHPNLLHVYDAGVDHNVYYIVMDYVDGGSLKDLIRQGPLETGRAVSIAAQVADALNYAHQQGFVHRDVKPANVLLTRDGRPLLADFGIARALDASMHLTRTGASIGTPEYMAPEQAEGQPADGRTDIYALGIVLYEMLTGQVPFSTPTPMATLYKQVHDPPPPLRQINTAVPPWLEMVVDKALAKRPQDRYRQASELAQALRQHRVPSATRPIPPPHRRAPVPADRKRKVGLVPILLGAIGVLLLILLASGTYMVVRNTGEKQAVSELPSVVTKVIVPEETATEVIVPEEIVTVIITSAPAETATSPPTVSASATPMPPPTDTPTTAATPTTAPPPTDTPVPATSTPTATQVPTKAPTQEPSPTKAPQATCPAWYSKPQPGKGILVIENHIGEELQVEQIQGGKDQWRIAAKQGDTPGRLLLHLAPGNQEFVLYLDRGGRGHIQLMMEAGQQSVSPVWISGSYDEVVYPLEIPPGCN